mgnify:CR=1 FL=1|tara:strand:- start:1651 stop:2637 length:987 start_codon:yes stop_codon:yes gene_type:complete
MEFFNKKQDVIDIQITPFGRHLMSRGVFNPVYYSFHDDAVLYNSEKGGFSEEQSDSQARIKETPLVKSATTFSSLEKKFAYQYGQKIFESKKFDSKAMQPTSEKMYSLWTSIGTSDLNSDPAPAVHLTFLKGNMSGSFSKTWNLKGQDGGINTRHIPQLKADIEIEYKNISPNDDAFYEYETGVGYDFALVTPPNEAYFLIKVGEEFAPYQKENFDIEVFEIVENEAGDLTEQVLRQLSFYPKETENEIFSWLDEPTPQDDPNYVNHYFDLLVDSEIDDKIICSLDPVSKTKGHFADRKTEFCNDLLDDEVKTYDIYEKEVDDPGEVC